RWWPAPGKSSRRLTRCPWPSCRRAITADRFHDGHSLGQVFVHLRLVVRYSYGKPDVDSPNAAQRTETVARRWRPSRAPVSRKRAAAAAIASPNGIAFGPEPSPPYDDLARARSSA